MKVSKREIEREMRDAAVHLLEQKGYTVTDSSEGSGVPKRSRLIIEKDGERLQCSVKTTMGGRISYTRKDDGRYFVLSDNDRVIHVRSKAEDASAVQISMFASDVVKKAFDTNFEALAAKGQDHLPLWVNPEPEESERVVGSGFQDEALWSETVSLTNHSEEKDSQSIENAHVSKSKKGLMEELTAKLASELGVTPDQIDIEVRIRA